MELGVMTSPIDEYDELEYLFVFRDDPIAKGNYDPHAGTTVRGSVIPTLGGVVVQDFGPMVMDQRISFSDEATLTDEDVTYLITLYELSSQELYFTDGYDCWKVQFSRPDGFKYKRNLISSFYNNARFDYEINLVVKEYTRE
jgi:hypothetical protein